MLDTHPASQRQSSPIDPHAFDRRHIGPNTAEIAQMLSVLGLASIEELVDRVVPQAIRSRQGLQLPAARTESEVLAQLKAIASKNQVFRSFIGMGYADCIVPPPIQRHLLENAGWYTAYTPYQAEIAQGRLEALLNFQTMIIDFTGLDIANASLLDEATAAAEAMSLSYGACKNKNARSFFVAQDCHPQTIDVVKTRAYPLGIEIVVGDWRNFEVDRPFFGALLQYPTTDGKVCDYSDIIDQIHQQKGFITVAADLLSLALLKPPGEFGADIAVGNTQRFGVPLGYGGPHAAYFATKESYKRQVPGRIVGVSKDSNGKPAYRLALQTREQHIRREKATSNICTAQVLLAVMASMYAVYHGSEGISAIAGKVHQLTTILGTGLQRLGYDIGSDPCFDTLRVEVGEKTTEILARAQANFINLRRFEDGAIGISLDEATTEKDILDLWHLFAGSEELPFSFSDIGQTNGNLSLQAFSRTTPYLTEPVFNRYHSETELLRYLYRLQQKDLSLTTSMIPLGSCTMKLNAAVEMMPVTWTEFGKIHPFAPVSQTQGYQILFNQLENWLAEITGFSAVSLQPNAGSQGEYAGLQVIRAYHASRSEAHRNICLIPESAHGTNPASAVMCGFKVVAIQCDDNGNIDLADLKSKAEKHANNLAAIMVTYPSTHGVFEEGIIDICAIVHQYGGQVYLDGANLNAQVGLCRPGDYGADVCHLNLHKTFCIPHGGGGPGMGPIGVASHLSPFLPGHCLVDPHQNGKGGKEVKSIGAIAAAPWGSSSILPISWAYIAAMGTEGLTQASRVAILNANYIASRLESYYPVLYKGESGFVAHECILDVRSLKKTADVTVEDIAKRLMDYGFHAPTVSWPVAGTMMVEPTESESQAELDRFCEAMISIRQEIAEIESGKVDRHNNLLKNAPHTAAVLLDSNWDRPYPRDRAAYPTQWTRDSKFWPPVGRIDNAYGDRNLVCSCQGMENYR